MKRFTSFVFLTFFVCGIADGQTGTADSDPGSGIEKTQLLSDLPVPKLSKMSQRDQRIRKLLEEPLELIFKEKPWSEIEAELETKLGCSIVLTRSATDDSLGPNEPISCDFRNVSGKTAIRNMLAPMNSTLVIKDGVIKIISLDDEDDIGFFSNYFFDVRPILRSIIARNQAIGLPKPIAEANRMENPETQLVDLIQTTIRQDEWIDTGQGMATIQIIGGCAVVSCSEQIADELRQFLGDLAYHLEQK